MIIWFSVITNKRAAERVFFSVILSCCLCCDWLVTVMGRDLLLTTYVAAGRKGKTHTAQSPGQQQKSSTKRCCRSLKVPCEIWLRWVSSRWSRPTMKICWKRHGVVRCGSRRASCNFCSARTSFTALRIWRPKRSAAMPLPSSHQRSISGNHWR